MTVVVETPDGIVTGSSVVQIDARLYPNGQPITNNIASFHFSGEAVAVEVAEGEWLFALLHPYPAILIHPTRPDLFGDTPQRDYRNWMPDIPNETDPVAMPEEYWPRFVTFTDINNPVTVVGVDPSDLSASFGEGVRLVEVTLEVTEDEVDFRGISSALLWLESLDGGALDGSRYSSINAENRLANDLSLYDFRRQ